MLVELADLDADLLAFPLAPREHRIVVRGGLLRGRLGGLARLGDEVLGVRLASPTRFVASRAATFPGMARSAQVGSLLSRMAGSRPTERLEALAQLRRELDSLETELAADALRAGHSWREIGAALGVSKQAAHRRHSHGIAQLDRAAETEHRGSPVIVSEAVRTAIRMARGEAAATGAESFGTEHLLLGLLQCGDPLTVTVLERVGVTLPVAREAIQPTVELSPGAAARARAVAVAATADGDGDGRLAPGPRSAVVSPLARRILARALAECSGRASPSLTALDLLRGLLKDEHGGAAQTLDRLGVEPRDVRAEIKRATA